jgi:hypothetical protein
MSVTPNHPHEPPTGTHTHGVSPLVRSTVWTRYRRLAREAPALLIRGTLQNTQRTCSLNADKLDALDLRVAHASRDFR